MRIELWLLILLPLLHSKRITVTENELRKEICGATSLRRSMALSFGGRHVRQNEFPWVVSIYVEGTGVICSGALISNRHVLTGAHCVRETMSDEVTDQEHCKEIGYTNKGKLLAAKDKYTLTIGARCREAKKCPYTHTRAMARVTVPDTFDECSMLNDIAIIELDWKVPESVAVPICMPDTSTKISRKLKAAGAGMISPEKDAKTDGYQVVNVELLGITKTNLLQTTTAEDVGVCNGDSGGPLFQTHNRKNTVVGVMSSGNTCDMNYPKTKRLYRGKTAHDYYTDVRAHIEWICGVTGVCPDEMTEPEDVDYMQTRSVPINNERDLSCPPGYEPWICEMYGYSSRIYW